MALNFRPPLKLFQSFTNNTKGNTGASYCNQSSPSHPSDNYQRTCGKSPSKKARKSKSTSEQEYYKAMKSGSAYSSLDEDIPIFDLLLRLNGLTEETVYEQNGYKKICKIENTMQGMLVKAINLKNKDNEMVMIKKADRELCKEHVSFADDNDLHFCVYDDIYKEMRILKFLTRDNTPSDDYIVKYIDFFETNDAHYLVTEYVFENTSLDSFFKESYLLIVEGKLKKKEYNKIVKYLAWQILAVLHYLHNDMKCCHLNLSAKNIKLEHAEFIQESDGLLIINPKINIKLTDFSKAEVFRDDNFMCSYFMFIQEGVQYISPEKQTEGIFDGEKADMWSLGMILYECVVGRYLYDSIYMNKAYEAVLSSNIKQYFAKNNILDVVYGRKLDVITSLLEVNEKNRVSSGELLKHSWFAAYWKRYSHSIKKKSAFQKKKKKKTKRLMRDFPYFTISDSISTIPEESESESDHDDLHNCNSK